MVNAFCSLTRLAFSFVAIKNFPGEYFTSTIFPGIGERLMCTSSGDKKILTTVGASASAAIAPARHASIGRRYNHIGIRRRHSFRIAKEERHKKRQQKEKSCNPPKPQCRR